MIFLLLFLDVLALAPGTPREDITAARASENVIRTMEPSLPRVFDRQITTMKFDADGRLVSVSIQIMPPFNSRPEDVLRLYRDVRGELLRAYGAPAWERTEGSAEGGNLLLRLNTGEVVRMLEWHRPHTVRAGIPRRVDGRILVEVWITAERLPRSELFWGEGGE